MGEQGFAGFEVKDSGKRTEFAGGMVRDTAEGKLDWSNLRFGPMPRRIVTHLTKGRDKYPDPEPGIPNWTLGRGIEVWLHARESYGRHNDAYLAGLKDEDHASALYFNVNVMEYVRQFFTPEEEAQAQKIEELQRERIIDEARIEDRKYTYLNPHRRFFTANEMVEQRPRVKQADASLDTPAPGGRHLLNLTSRERDEICPPGAATCKNCPCAPELPDGTGLDENGDAHAPDCGRRDPHDFSGCSRD